MPKDKQKSAVEDFELAYTLASPEYNLYAFTSTKSLIDSIQSEEKKIESLLLEKQKMAVKDTERSNVARQLKHIKGYAARNILDKVNSEFDMVYSKDHSQSTILDNLVKQYIELQLHSFKGNEAEFKQGLRNFLVQNLQHHYYLHLTDIMKRKISIMENKIDALGVSLAIAKISSKEKINKDQTAKQYRSGLIDSANAEINRLLDALQNYDKYIDDLTDNHLKNPAVQDLIKREISRNGESKNKTSTNAHSATLNISTEIISPIEELRESQESRLQKTRGMLQKQKTTLLLHRKNYIKAQENLKASISSLNKLRIQYRQGQIQTKDYKKLSKQLKAEVITNRSIYISAEKMADQTQHTMAHVKNNARSYIIGMRKDDDVLSSPKTSLSPVESASSESDMEDSDSLSEEGTPKTKPSTL